MCKPNGNETAPLLQELENQRSPVASFAEKSLMNRLEKTSCKPVEPEDNHKK
jgi:hypothetical protein